MSVIQHSRDGIPSGRQDFMTNIVQLDRIDRAILTVLQEDADVSHAALAERVGASTASCWRRIKALQESGVLRKSVRLVDAARVGKGVNVLCHVRMKSHAPDQRRAFEDFIRDRVEVMDCYSMSGDWDYLLRIVAEDLPDCERFLMRVLLNHPSVATTSSHFALMQVKYTTAVPV
jgi:Lrp/AsnC family transcriptional regulator